MTPYEIDILLHYYCRADDHPDIDRAPSIWLPTIEKFKEQGLLVSEITEHRSYSGTDKLVAYCEALQRVPLPVQVWITPKDCKCESPS